MDKLLIIISIYAYHAALAGREIPIYHFGKYQYTRSITWKSTTFRIKGN